MRMSCVATGRHVFVCGLTFELSGRQRQVARPGLQTMYRVPAARAWRPAAGAPLERVVRPQLAMHAHELCTDLPAGSSMYETMAQRYFEPRTL